mmetsp:Transcript_18664/g.70899  ORF Transcript_18664/g.70899 Transcript_18664/m.70899 type:complete len:330 (+) Transcript_18664:2633-3622(+)
MRGGRGGNLGRQAGRRRAGFRHIQGIVEVVEELELNGCCRQERATPGRNSSGARPSRHRRAPSRAAAADSNGSPRKRTGGSRRGLLQRRWQGGDWSSRARPAEGCSQRKAGGRRGETAVGRHGPRAAWPVADSAGRGQGTGRSSFGGTGPGRRCPPCNKAGDASCAAGPHAGKRAPIGRGKQARGRVGADGATAHVGGTHASCIPRLGTNSNAKPPDVDARPHSARGGRSTSDTSVWCRRQAGAGRCGDQGRCAQVGVEIGSHQRVASRALVLRDRGCDCRVSAKVRVGISVVVLDSACSGPTAWCSRRADAASPGCCSVSTSGPHAFP